MPPRDPTPKITRGGLRLRDHIAKYYRDGGKTAFAERAGVERITVLRVLTGKAKWISVDFAVAVERTTAQDAGKKGRIPAEDFLRETAIPVSDAAAA